MGHIPDQAYYFNAYSSICLLNDKLQRVVPAVVRCNAVTGLYLHNCLSHMVDVILLGSMYETYSTCPLTRLMEDAYVPSEEKKEILRTFRNHISNLIPGTLIQDDIKYHYSVEWLDLYTPIIRATGGVYEPTVPAAAYACPDTKIPHCEYCDGGLTVCEYCGFGIAKANV